MERSRHSIKQKLITLRMMEAERYTGKKIEEAHRVYKITLPVESQIRFRRNRRLEEFEDIEPLHQRTEDCGRP